MFFEIWYNSQENICARVSFLIKLQAPFHTEHLWWLLLLLVIFGGQKFQVKKYSRNLFWWFWPQTAKWNSVKIIEIGSIAKSFFAKFSFFPDIFVYLAVTAEQLYNKNKKVKQHHVLVTKLYKHALKCVQDSKCTYI